VVDYLPFPILALRTLKSEVAVGLSAGQPAELTRVDRDWLTDGRWGVMQFYQSDG
jgi:hypothetical protein